MHQLFGRAMFLAHDKDLPKPDDYFSFQLGDRSLTLRKKEDAPVLLDNVCRHRSNLIDPPGFGNRKFKCGYHGWTYDHTGSATFIPLRNCFPDDLSPEPLQRFGTTSLNGFHFLGEYDSVRREEISAMLGWCEQPDANHVYRSKMHHKCNWKLMVENVLEGYHLSHVHSNTFYQLGFSSTNRMENTFNDRDSAFVIHPDEKLTREALSAFPDIVPSFRHVYVFPNLFITLSNELLYYIGNIVPLNEQESMLHYRIYPTRKLLAADMKARRAFLAGAIQFMDDVLKEDREVLETSQIGIRGASSPYLLGDNEIRIRHFHDVYERAMSGAAGIRS
ncbi:SRPBCC family protein [Herbaspirillum sp. WKF16]|uniref:aromatic ring-hydroxylating oxygenase subunit alpha n=1 Tax=Herbaspirillum sp. WKF16 TaxID=3028312 RepID=UPI0023A9C599|nr:SRPBCC family protein [Herbaspirillum sp. WKF16]WDZ95746.1 SRPBCC family protein [Herbaspirillum sp. WKF16]